MQNRPFRLGTLAVALLVPGFLFAQDPAPQGEDPAAALFDTMPPPGEEETTDAPVLHLLLTDVISPTELHLIFSTKPFIEPEAAPLAFVIMDSEENVLPIESITIVSEEVTVRTQEQTPGRTYTLTLSPPLRGEDGAPLDGEHRQSTFVGHEGNPEETLQTNPPASLQDQMRSPAPVRGLRLAASPAPDGTSLVRATWETDAEEEVAYYSVRQSRDGGSTFGAPELLAGNIGVIEIPGVTPGQYGLGIRTLNGFGFSSGEVFTGILVGPQEPPVASQSLYSAAPAIDRQIETVPPASLEANEGLRSKNLPRSGAGMLLAALGGLGMATGWRRQKTSANA